MNSLLYLFTILIWGSTWIAISFQIGAVPVEVSAFFRFALAGIVMTVVLLASRRLAWLPLRQHPWLLLQGLLLFCINFLFFYNAAAYVTSGLIAVVFSMATLFNALNGAIFLRRPIEGRTLLAITFGVAGVCGLFWDDLAQSNWGGDSLTGLALALGGTYCFSLGNLVSLRNQKAGHSVPVANTYAIAYGTLALGLWSLSQGYSFTVDPSPKYLWALIFLAVPGTVIAFTTYLKLVGRVGPERAAYCTVFFPIVALAISTFVEGYQWNMPALIGVALALTGNVVIFSKRRKPLATAPVKPTV